MIKRWIFITSFIFVTAALGFTDGFALTFDWDTDANGNNIETGQVIDEEYADWGMHVSTENFVRSYDKAITFDSENPTGDDWDLETGGSTGHDPYDNVLIISERNYDGNGDGLIDTPDDEFSTNNGFSGYINFDFDFDLVSGGFDLLDIQYDWSKILFYDDGVLLTDEIIWVAPGNDNNMQTINFSGFEFDQIQFWFGPGGAIAEMWVTQAPPAVPTPEPATWLFLSSTIALTAGIYRRKKREEKEG